MTNEETTAVAKAISDKALKHARSGLSVGRHEVDVTVRIHGSLSVFADTDKTPTVSIPMKETLALFIRYCGITREAAISVLTRAMTDALDDSTEGAGAVLAALPVLEETMNTIVNPMLKSLPRTPVKGMVKPDLVIEELVLV